MGNSIPTQDLTTYKPAAFCRDSGKVVDLRYETCVSESHRFRKCESIMWQLPEDVDPADPGFSTLTVGEGDQNFPATFHLDGSDCHSYAMGHGLNCGPPPNTENRPLKCVPLESECANLFGLPKGTSDYTLPEDPSSEFKAECHWYYGCEEAEDVGDDEDDEEHKGLVKCQSCPGRKC